MAISRHPLKLASGSSFSSVDWSLPGLRSAVVLALSILKEDIRLERT
jgi:hypothetical protein